MAGRPAEHSALREELLQRMQRDQAVRTCVPPNTPQTDEQYAEFVAVDASNTAFLKRVVAQHGWPGRDLVGEEAAHAAWLLAQHADRDVAFQRSCLPLLEEAAAAGQATWADHAYLVDRVSVADGRPQVYGTQYGMREGRLELQPVEDPDRLDKRRAHAGLGPHAEYDRMHRQLYG
ncbi:hypothetical protein E1286_07655 [Nonomuraea terrae]|uniref:Uncharacterized protein n=1 Tax=Nonomuraea terrae TaxID=2530383 RepID=A0A4R4Z5V9_9ACTN|nr:DUF6624 domain-containing protein [Nonomuraea terrae]TDD53286.1 hypothetical protein E1286_07655 [Nonomuraea terrae]